MGRRNDKQSANRDVLYDMVAGEAETGRELLEVLSEHLAENSLSAIRKSIRSGLVTVNGRGAHPGDRLSPSDHVVIREAGALSKVTTVAAPDEPLEVLHEDERCLVVNKPPGIPVLPTRDDPVARFNAALLEHLRERSPFATDRPVRPRLVHRIDRDASGALIVAKDRKAMSHLTDQFAGRRLKKRYLALVGGEILEDEGTIDVPILEVSKRRERAKADESGRESVTHWRVLEQFRGLTWVECRPETGRTHQIRVHMKALGHPLAIDPLYGSGKPLYLSKLKPGYKRKRDAAERPLLARLPLHAAACTFNPPGADPDALLTVEAPLSKDMQVALKLIRRHVHH